MQCKDTLFSYIHQIFLNFSIQAIYKIQDMVSFLAETIS